jgi:hypothetical protein
VLQAVLLVIGVQDEQHVERPRQHAVWRALGLGAAPQHIQETLGVAEIVIRVDIGQTQAVPVSERGERRHFANKPEDLQVAHRWVVDVLGIS